MTCPESYDGAQLPGPYRSDLNAIYNSSQHLLALVDDVLDLARIEVGKISLERDQVDLVSLVTEATAMIRDYIVAKGLDLRIHIAPDLPQIWIDRLRIRQVLLNLLVNAARFTERGWIEVDIRQQDEDVLVRVTDTGEGIPEQNLPIRGLVQPQHRPAHGGLAAAGFPDQPQRLPLVDIEADVVHRLDISDVALNDDPPSDGKILPEVADLDQGFSLGNHYCVLPATNSHRQQATV